MGVRARDRAIAAGFGLVGVERWVGPARLAGSRPGLFREFGELFVFDLNGFNSNQIPHNSNKNHSNKSETSRGNKLQIQM